MGWVDWVSGWDEDPAYDEYDILCLVKTGSKAGRREGRTVSVERSNEKADSVRGPPCPFRSYLISEVPLAAGGGSNFSS